LEEFFALYGKPDLTSEDYFDDDGYDDYNDTFYEDEIPDEASIRDRYNLAKRHGLTIMERQQYVEFCKHSESWMESYRRVMRRASPTGKYISYGKAVAIHDRVGYFTVKTKEEEDGRHAYQTFQSLTGSD